VLIDILKQQKKEIIAIVSQDLKQRFTVFNGIKIPLQGEDVLKSAAETIFLIRRVEQVEDDGIKGLRPSEVENKPIVRKSIAASRKIKQNEITNAEVNAIKRPEYVIRSIDYWGCIGTFVNKDYNKFELIV
jgi:hypothetical protein